MATVTQAKQVNFDVVCSKQFKKKYLVSPESSDNRCMICFGDLAPSGEEGSLDCNRQVNLVAYHNFNSSSNQKSAHAFHLMCIDEWWYKFNSCPLCNAQVSNTGEVYKKAKRLLSQTACLSLFGFKKNSYSFQIQNLLEKSKQVAADSFYLVRINLIALVGLVALQFLWRLGQELV